MYDKNEKVMIVILIALIISVLWNAALLFKQSKQANYYEIGTTLQEAHVDMCIDGVTYMRFSAHNSVTVKYNKSGRIERCER